MFIYVNYTEKNSQTSCCNGEGKKISDCKNCKDVIIMIKINKTHYSNFNI